MVSRFFQIVIQLATPKGFVVLRIRYPAVPIESGEFVLAAFSHGFDQPRVRMAGEKAERRRLAVFFSHENQRHKRRKQYRARRQLERLERNKPAQPLASESVSNLVMVLCEHNKALRWEPMRRVAMPPLPRSEERRV